MLRIIHQMKTRDQRGFTLIELLIVIAIIAILAAIAIPQFAAYRERGVRASMVADARNLATIEEATFSDNQSYADVAATSSPFTVGTQSARPSQGNNITVSGAPTTYTILIINANGGNGSTHYTLDNSGAAPGWSN
jgi:type IV pilus assembly protein PilA